MIDITNIGGALLSKQSLFYVFCVFFLVVGIVTLVLLYHWTKYSKEVDTKYKVMEIVYIAGIIFMVMVCFSSYMLI